MSFNFPNSPNTNDAYTPVGGPTYVWDGQKWVMTGTTSVGVTAQAYNRIVNGAMQHSQENGDTASAIINYYMADQWRASGSGTATWSFKRQAGASLYGGSYFLSLSTTTTMTMAAGDYYSIWQPLEGVRMADFQWGTANAKQVVLRFGFSGPLGTYTMSLRTPGSPFRRYAAPFTVTQANQWQAFTFVIPGDTTVSSAWATDTNQAVGLWIVLASGTTQASNIAGWSGAGSVALPGTENNITSGDVFQLSDVGLYLDPDNTGVPPKWVMPDYASELAACQRYYQFGINSIFSGNVTSPAQYFAYYKVAPAMRTTPTITGANGANSSFPATVGTFQWLNDGFYEARAANATANGALFRSSCIANARM